MKKSLLSLAVALCACLSASALTRLPLPQNTSFNYALFPAMADKVAFKAPAKAEGEASMDYNLSGDPYTAIGYNTATNGQRFAAAICMNEDDATLFAGNKITAINFYNGVCETNNKINYIQDYTVFLAYDLQGERLYEQAYKSTRKAYEYQTVALDRAITIEAGKELFIGIEYAVKTSKDYGAVVDGLYHGGDDYGGWLASFDTTKNAFVWENISEYFGYNCISATVTGDALPVNGAYISDFYVPSNTYIDSPFEFDVLICNKASNEITSVELTYTIGDGKPVSKTVTLDTPIAYGQEIPVAVTDAVYDKVGPDVAFDCKLTKVNGVDNSVANNGFETGLNFMAPGEGFAPRVVGEEFTSIHCGYCPWGITNMENLVEEYPDTFILVAVHGNMSATQRDPMTSSSFSTLMNNFTTSFPYATLNRTYSINPQDAEALQAYTDQLTATIVPYFISAECELSEDLNTVTVNTTTKFAFDTDNSSDRYRISYVLVEDKVGPYTQSNYYSGQQGDYGGWESKGQSVKMLFDNVGRYMDGYPGVANTVPAKITAGADNKNSHNVKIANVSKVENMSVVVYLVDSDNNVILNACKVKSCDIKGNESAITDIVTDNSAASVEYYNLQGVRVENPSSGLYIRRQGTEVKKVIL